MQVEIVITAKKVITFLDGIEPGTEEFDQVIVDGIPELTDEFDTCDIEDVLEVS